MNESFNSQLRRAAGRHEPLERQGPDAPPGHLGGGRGGTCGPPRRETGTEQINGQIRRAARIARLAAAPGGIRLDTIDVDWRR